MVSLTALQKTTLEATGHGSDSDQRNATFPFRLTIPACYHLVCHRNTDFSDWFEKLMLESPKGTTLILQGKRLRCVQHKLLFPFPQFNDKFYCSSPFTQLKQNHGLLGVRVRKECHLKPQNGQHCLIWKKFFPTS